MMGEADRSNRRRTLEAQQEGSWGLIPEDGIHKPQRGRPAAGHWENKQLAKKVTVACLKNSYTLSPETC